MGIATILDRIIQECIRIVIEPIVEAKFYPHSYGFRPYRSCKHAVSQIISTINITSHTKPIYAIEGDIKSYFDNINHKILLQKLWKIGVKDRRVIMIIKEMLIAGYMEEDIVEYTNTGTAQGSVISPLLANVYLNDFDWTIGRMYENTKYDGYELIESKRRQLTKKGIIPKYLIRYADDWLVLTKSEQEAKRLLHYLKKYFEHKLKLKLSEDKTVITNLTKMPAKFLGFLIKAEKPRATHKRPDVTNAPVIGKNYPNPSKVKEQVKKISKEIRNLKSWSKEEHKAVQIEKINAIITGVAEYWKTSICSKTFNYIDDKIDRSAWITFRKIYGKDYRKHEIPLNMLSNRPQRHRDYKWKSFAVFCNDMWIGLTKAGITHSCWERYPFNQRITPYTAVGRELYVKQFNKMKKLPLDRPPLYDVETLIGAVDRHSSVRNFEYFMNREYAFNRDLGKCKICGIKLMKDIWQCHHVNRTLRLNEINKVKNLAWLCVNCHQYVHGAAIPVNTRSNNKIIKKIEKYKNKLK